MEASSNTPCSISSRGGRLVTAVYSLGVVAYRGVGVQGNTPGKLDRSRSDEGKSEANFPKGHSLPAGGGRTGKGMRVGAGDRTGTGVYVWGQGYCAPNSRWCVSAGQVDPQSAPRAGPESYSTRGARLDIKGLLHKGEMLSTVTSLY
jgi:hypothetical protein